MLSLVAGAGTAAKLPGGGFVGDVYGQFIARGVEMTKFLRNRWPLLVTGDFWLMSVSASHAELIAFLDEGESQTALVARGYASFHEARANV